MTIKTETLGEQLVERCQKEAAEATVRLTLDRDDYSALWTYLTNEGIALTSDCEPEHFKLEPGTITYLNRWGVLSILPRDRY